MPNKDIKNWIMIGISAVFAIALVVGFFMSLISPEAFLAVVGPIVGYYFGGKAQTKIVDAQNKAIEALSGHRIEVVELNAKKEV